MALRSMPPSPPSLFILYYKGRSLTLVFVSFLCAQARPFTVTTNDTMGNTATFKTHALILSTGADSNWRAPPCAPS